MEAKPRNSKRESPIKEFTGLDYTAIAEELEVTPQLLHVWKNYTATNNRLQREQRQYAETA
nr:MAG TPA: chromosome anchoring protein [Caudoviricetes sp.]